MLRVLTIIAAIIIFVVGAITLPLPIPTGLLLISISIAMLIGVSKIVRVMIKKLRRNYPIFNALMLNIEAVAPKTIRDALHRTGPRKNSRKSAH